MPNLPRVLVRGRDSAHDGKPLRTSGQFCKRTGTGLSEYVDAKGTQMQNRSLLLLTALTAAACALPSAKQAPIATTLDAIPKCSPVSNAQDVLARHSRGYGSKEAVAHALPISFAGEVVTKGKRGSVELVLGPEGRYSQVTVAGGMLSADGVDAKGPWTLPNAGVPIRLHGDEAADLVFAAWLQGRDYLVSFELKRDASSCKASDPDGRQISVRYQLPAIGNPELTFSFGDAALLSATHFDINGHPVEVSFRAWSDADQVGVRWPLTTHSVDGSGNETFLTFTRSAAGVECPSRPSEECFAPPRSRLAFSWPKESPVRVPAAFFFNEVFLHAKLGDRMFWGLVDSGATLNVVDKESWLAGAFQPPLAAERSKPDQPSQFAFGELGGSVELGDLIVQHFPAAAVSMPSFDEFGQRRPEILFGYPLFLGTAVRIDYARQEVLLSPEASSLHAESAIAIPLKVLGQIVAAEATIDDVAGLFVLDSGDSECLDLFSDWAANHHFPGPRPAYAFRQHAEFGDSQANEKRMRPTSFDLGPIHLKEPLVAIDSVPSPSNRIAGQVGNGVLARCAAVVFDIPKRTLWFEPPCDRDQPEDLSGWVLERRDSVSKPNRPWVVRQVLPGGSADLAGVQVGDRILKIGGLDAILEISTFELVTKQTPGTKVHAVILRGSDVKEITLRLVRRLSQ